MVKTELTRFVLRDCCQKMERGKGKGFLISRFIKTYINNSTGEVYFAISNRSNIVLNARL